jgi:hypothetical protein
MSQTRQIIEIEDIDYLRRRNGIDDEKLREDIRGLHVGDFVKLTFLAGSGAAETLSVRITSIGDSAFRGKLATAPTASSLAKLHLGSLVVFTAANIHSLPRTKPTP